MVPPLRLTSLHKGSTKVPHRCHKGARKGTTKVTAKSTNVRTNFEVLGFGSGGRLEAPWPNLP